MPDPARKENEEQAQKKSREDQNDFHTSVIVCCTSEMSNPIVNAAHPGHLHPKAQEMPSSWQHNKRTTTSQYRKSRKTTMSPSRVQLLVSEKMLMIINQSWLMSWNRQHNTQEATRGLYHCSTLLRAKTWTHLVVHDHLIHGRELDRLVSDLGLPWHLLRVLLQQLQQECGDRQHARTVSRHAQQLAPIVLKARCRRFILKAKLPSTPN